MSAVSGVRTDVITNLTNEATAVKVTVRVCLRWEVLCPLVVKMLAKRENGKTGKIPGKDAKLSLNKVFRSQKPSRGRAAIRRRVTRNVFCDNTNLFIYNFCPFITNETASRPGIRGINYTLPHPHRLVKWYPKKT
jgi:hypothetical protein